MVYIYERLRRRFLEEKTLLPEKRYRAVYKVAPDELSASNYPDEYWGSYRLWARDEEEHDWQIGIFQKGRGEEETFPYPTVRLTFSGKPGEKLVSSLETVFQTTQKIIQVLGGGEKVQYETRGVKAIKGIFGQEITFQIHPPKGASETYLTQSEVGNLAKKILETAGLELDYAAAGYRGMTEDEFRYTCGFLEENCLEGPREIVSPSPRQEATLFLNQIQLSPQD